MLRLPVLNPGFESSIVDISILIVADGANNNRFTADTVFCSCLLVAWRHGV